MPKWPPAQSIQSNSEPFQGYNVYQDFWTHHLNTINGSLPAPALWHCTLNFHKPSDAYNNQNTVITDNWQAHDYELSLIYAQTIHFTGDGINTSDVGFNNAPFLKGHISNGRKDLEKIKVNYLETNMSYTDSYIRPWAEAIAYMGLIEKSLRATMTVIGFQKVNENTGVDLDRKGFQKKIGPTWQPRKIIQFERVCPIHVNSQEFSYKDQQMNNMTVEFLFDSYYVWTYNRPEHINKTTDHEDPWWRDPRGATLGKISGVLGDIPRPGVTGNLWADTALNKATNIVAKQADRIASNIISAPFEVLDRAQQRATNVLSTVAQDIGNRITREVDRVTNRVSGALGLGGQDEFGVRSINQEDTPTMGSIDSPSVGRSVMSHSQHTPRKINQFDNLQQKSKASEPSKDDDTPTFGNRERTTDSGVLKDIGSGSTKEMVKGAIDTPLFFGTRADTEHSKFISVRQKDTPDFPYDINDVNIDSDDTPEGLLIDHDNHRPKTQSTTPSQTSGYRFIKPDVNDTPNPSSIPVQIVSIKK